MIGHVELTVPGKAFFAGEYLAMTGGPALVATVGPRFKMIAERTSGLNQNPFHELSPAGKFWIENKNRLQNYNIEFIDPHQGAGGWGGSTAEFALLSALDQIVHYQESDQLLIDHRHLLMEYQRLAWDGQSIYKPSGSDLVSQITGGLVYFDRNNGKLEKFNWPFEKLGFCFFQTGIKIKTHEHLQGLRELNTEPLHELMNQVISSLKSANETDFCSNINLYWKKLEELGLTAQSTQELLGQMKRDGVMAMKGCGALGADVILIIYDKTKLNSQELSAIGQEHGLNLKATDLDLARGISYQFDEYDHQIGCSVTESRP
ncbi:MAG: hypothetical protein BroJett040_10890 [Oligoflexia bacterium]|nr:MAG: hypothetical protein BroJett040_10890 [Oligoflexia bacterium]